MAANALPKPRPIEFMLRGHSVATMLEILKHWDVLSPVDLERLGFTSLRSDQSSSQDSLAEDGVFRLPRRSQPNLLCVQGGLQSDQDSKR